YFAAGVIVNGFTHAAGVPPAVVLGVIYATAAGHCCWHCARQFAAGRGERARYSGINRLHGLLGTGATALALAGWPWRYPAGRGSVQSGWHWWGGQHAGARRGGTAAGVLPVAGAG